MIDVPVQQTRRSRLRLLVGGIAAAVLVATVTIVPGVAHATTVTTNQTGINNGYFHIYVKDDPGTATLTLGPGSRYAVQWSGINSLVTGMGWSTGRRMTVAYRSTFSTTSNAYLGVYGWTTDPLVEYNIVENWGTWRPQVSAVVGTVITDGGTYDIFRTLRINQPSIQGIATYYQYWSVRTAKRTAGAITTGNHFDAWARLGMNLGSTHDYMVVATTAFQSSGRADITISEPACC